MLWYYNDVRKKKPDKSLNPPSLFSQNRGAPAKAGALRTKTSEAFLQAPFRRPQGRLCFCLYRADQIAKAGRASGWLVRPVRYALFERFAGLARRIAQAIPMPITMPRKLQIRSSTSRLLPKISWATSKQAPLQKYFVRFYPQQCKLHFLLNRK